MPEYLFESPPLKIGKKEWRVVVYRTAHYGLCTTYEWRNPAWIIDGVTWQPADHWRNMDQWPGYDSNDGENEGCPRSLRKLFYKHRTELENAMAGISVASMEEMLELELK